MNTILGHSIVVDDINNIGVGLTAGLTCGLQFGINPDSITASSQELNNEVKEQIMHIVNKNKV